MISTETDGTIEEFYKLAREIYEGNHYIAAVEFDFSDGQKPVQIAFRSQLGFQEHQKARRGIIEQCNNGRELRSGVTIDEFCKFVRTTYEGNNYVSCVEARFYGSDRKVAGITFKSPEGFQENQKGRRGTINASIENLMD